MATPAKEQGPRDSRGPTADLDLVGPESDHFQHIDRPKLAAGLGHNSLRPWAISLVLVAQVVPF
jgi:hypothetical protein